MEEVIILSKKFNPDSCAINRDVIKKWDCLRDDSTTASMVATQLGAYNRPLTALDIILSTCKHYGVSLDQVLSKSTDEKVCLSRKIAVHLVKFSYCMLTNRQIAELMNRKNASFVNRCVNDVNYLCQYSRHYETIREDLLTIKRSLLVDSAKTSRFSK